MKRSDLIRQDVLVTADGKILGKKAKERISAALAKSKTPAAAPIKRKPCGCGRKHKNINTTIK